VNNAGPIGDAEVLLEQRHAFQKQVISRARRNLPNSTIKLATQKVCSRLVKPKVAGA